MIEMTKPAQHPVFRKATALFEEGKIEEAILGYKQVLSEQPDDVPSWLNLGTALRRQGHYQASAAATKRALDIRPGNVMALTNLGNCLVDLDRIDEAVAVHAEALRLKPDDFLIRRNYAIALREAGAFEKALPEFDILQKIRPDDHGIGWERALTFLYLGRYEEGWDAFEIRWKHPSMKERRVNAPRWQGEDIAGKTLLIHEEQGFGDTILCSRYIPLVAARGGRVILECKKPLHRLMSGIPGITQMAEPGKVAGTFDYHIPMMSLPGIFKTDLSSIPPAAPLHVPSELPVEAARLLARGKGRFKVGIVWSGSVTFGNNRKRSADASRFLPFAEIPGVQLYSLQKGPREEDLAACGGDSFILALGPHLNDFADTAAVLKGLDLVIMTDSSVAHLAGSLGVPVWNLLHYRPYWLYLSDREDSPWYPSMRFIRQNNPGDWDAVFERTAKTLAEAAKGHATRT